jgi:hypothetical protein
MRGSRPRMANWESYDDLANAPSIMLTAFWMP